MSTWRLERTADGVWVQGEIDLAKAVKFADAVNAAIADAASDRFALDLSGVTFIDSTGAYALTTLGNAHPSLDFVIQTSLAVFRVPRANRGDGRSVAKRRGLAATRGRTGVTTSAPSLSAASPTATRSPHDICYRQERPRSTLTGGEIKWETPGRLS
jgi:ABC-type transporter Mla MlaB component